ncbi:MAG TPA: hypothetical protein VLU96_13160 [Gaiellaceae bacterium]|nr:hypothetical protein [Gaiellaceae bacterium]
MDLQLAFRVLWRFKILVAVGFVLACLLALLAMVRVHPGGSPFFSYRTQPQYESDTTVFVTVPGFWPGNVNFRTEHGPVPVDALRAFASLAPQFANSTDVMSQLAKSGPIHGTVSATQALAQDSSTLPVIMLSAIAPTAAGAHSLAERHLHAFQSWLRDNQNLVDTNPNTRIILKPEIGPTPAHLLAGRKKTKAILVFLATLVVFCGLAFLLENLHPRIRAVAEAPEENPADAEARTLTAYNTPASSQQPIGRKRSRRARRRA